MANGVQRIGYILVQGNPASKESYNPSGYQVVGMAGSLATTFRTREAAAQYALKKGLTIRNHLTPAGA